MSDAKHTATEAQVAHRIYQQYLGAMALLGRAVGRGGNRFDLGQVDRAFADLNTVLHNKGSEILFAKDSNGGWSAFQRDQLETVARATGSSHA